jgi:hypothetical protein
MRGYLAAVFWSARACLQPRLHGGCERGAPGADRPGRSPARGRGAAGESHRMGERLGLSGGCGIRAAARIRSARDVSASVMEIGVRRCSCSHVMPDRGTRCCWSMRCSSRASARTSCCAICSSGRRPSTWRSTGSRASSCPAGSTGSASASLELSAGLGPGDALLLFPEGRNFTAGRRTASIAASRLLGEHAAAEQAREMRHVLLPRTGGAAAALSAATGRGGRLRRAHRTRGPVVASSTCGGARRWMPASG